MIKVAKSSILQLYFSNKLAYTATIPHKQNATQFNVQQYHSSDVTTAYSCRVTIGDPLYMEIVTSLLHIYLQCCISTALVKENVH